MTDCPPASGVHVLDFSDLLALGIAGNRTATGVGARTIASMRLARPDAWSAKKWQQSHPGFVFANDLGRGLDAFFVPGMA